MKAIMIIIFIFVIWFVSTQLGIDWPRMQVPEISPTPGSLPEQQKQPISDLTLEEMEHLVFEKINDVRIENNRAPLKESEHLTQKAREHSFWMADTGKFTHSTYNYCENIWWGVNISPSRLADRIVKSWVESKGHRANLLEVEISKCGIGISFDENTRSHRATFMAY